jgi:hypothetical protein
VYGMCCGHAVIVNPLSKVSNVLVNNLQGHGSMGPWVCSRALEDPETSEVS